jgi:hypothetical protein
MGDEGAEDLLGGAEPRRDVWPVEADEAAGTRSRLTPVQQSTDGCVLIEQPELFVIGIYVQALNLLAVGGDIKMLCWIVECVKSVCVMIPSPA